MTILIGTSGFSYDDWVGPVYPADPPKTEWLRFYWWWSFANRVGSTSRHFVGIDSTKHSMVMSASDEENGVGMKPSELLLVALGGCTAYDVVNILTKKRQRLTGLEVEASGEQLPDLPWTYTKIHLHYRLRGRGLSKKAVRDARALDCG